GIDEIWWHDQVAEPQRWQENLAEAAREDHGLAVIESLEGRDGPADISILTVVVVFEDPRPSAARPIEELQSPAHCHHRSQRKLMRGRDVDQPRFATASNAGLDAQSFVVDGRRNESGWERPEHRTDDGMTRILDADRVARIEQAANRQIQTMLDA